MLEVPVLCGPRVAAPSFIVEVCDSVAALDEWFSLRHSRFVEEQGLFDHSDRDDVDDDPRTVVLLARATDGRVIGGVRLWPATTPDLGWWQGGRLVADPGHPGVGAALVRAACAHAESRGVLRFEATVQSETFFRRLGWEVVGHEDIGGLRHARVRWPIGRVQSLVTASKGGLGRLLRGLHLGGTGWVGDDASPVPGSDLVAACDAIVPSMVERDPEWAGWCGVLVNVNDLAAMGAEPVGLLDAVAGADCAHVTRVMEGVRRAADAWGVPVLGGHTQTGVPAALSITALGRTARPVAAGAGRLGDRVHLTADLSGSWRPGYTGRQWDSTSRREPSVLQAQQRAVAASGTRAAKDVSMAGIAGTLGMLAEASGLGAVLDMAALPRPDRAAMGDWITCFPGFAMLTTSPLEAPGTQGAACAELVAGQGVSLRWPDGTTTTAIDGGVTGLGRAA